MTEGQFKDAAYNEVKERFTIQAYEEKVARLESEVKELRHNNMLLESQYRSQRETQADILKNLHANMEENYQKIEDQSRYIEKIENQLADQKQAHKEKMESDQATWTKQIEGLHSQKEELQSQLDSVRDFQAKQKQVEGELSDARQKLQNLELEHIREISHLDRKKAIEIDQLKKDMLFKIQQTRNQLRLKTKDQLEMTTKRTIMENEQMTTELHFQSRETERLLDKNRELAAENSQLKRDIQIHQELEDELARRTHVYQKLMKKLHQKMKNVSNESQNSLPENMDMSATLESLEQTSREERSAREKERESLHHTLSTLRYEFAQYRRDHATLTQLQDQTTRLVIAALYDLKNQVETGPFPPSSFDENQKDTFTSLTPKQRETFFRMLLEKLNESLCSMCMPVGHGQSQQLSIQSTTLPSIRPTGEGNFSNFLQSMSVTQHAMQSHSLCGETKSTQTATNAEDPCFKPRGFFGQERMPPSASIVCSPLRDWGSKSITQRSTRRRMRS